MVDIPSDPKSQIQTAAFCAYVMRKENCDEQKAVQIMAYACAVMEEVLGFGNPDANKKTASRNG